MIEYLNELCEKYLSLKGKQKVMEDLKENLEINSRKW